MEKMPAGSYYVGDLCYVFTDDEWDEVCSLVIAGEECLDGKFKMRDGREFVMFSTQYGDGTYCDTGGNKYPVDSGSIGCILANSVNNNFSGFGNVINFKNDFLCSSHDGILKFGHIAINTADDEIYEYD